VGIEDDLQWLLYGFTQFCTKYDLKISSKKMKSLTVSKEPLRCELQIYNNTIEQVLSFNNFSIQITSFKDLHAEVRHQAIRASKISRCLNETIWSNKHLRNKTKVCIYKSVVRLILTYAAETRADMVRTTQILEATEMKMLRRILNKTWIDKIRNKRIR
jgi:hypothetical protein